MALEILLLEIYSMHIYCNNDIDIDIYTHKYIYAHTYTYIHIYTHIYKIHIFHQFIAFIFQIGKPLGKGQFSFLNSYSEVSGTAFMWTQSSTLPACSSLHSKVTTLFCEIFFLFNLAPGKLKSEKGFSCTWARNKSRILRGIRLIWCKILCPLSPHFSPWEYVLKDN